MVVRKKYLMIVALTLCGIAVLAWAISSYMAKRAKQEQYQQALAQRFDQVYDVAYPLVTNYALSLNDKADALDSMRNQAMAKDSTQYNFVLYSLWAEYIKTAKARNASVLQEEIEYFRNSPVFSLLMNSGEKRQKEAEAIQKLIDAGQLLLDPFLLSSDSLKNATKRARQFLSDGQEVLKPYRSENTNYRSWRDIR